MVKTFIKKMPRLVASLLLLSAQFMPFMATAPRASATYNPPIPDKKVGICHATGSNSNPYSYIEVDDDAVNGNGQSDHNRSDHQNGEDIIPPFYTDNSAGYWNSRNWDSEGQAIFNNDCELPKTTIEVVKNIIPSTDSGKFNLSVVGKKTVSNVGNNGTTGAVEVSDRQDTVVSEKAGTATSLSDYTTNIVCKDNNGLGSIVESGTSSDSTERKLTVKKEHVDSGDKIVCVITNTRKTATLRINKEVVNGTVGTKIASDFSVTVNGSAGYTSANNSFDNIDSDSGFVELTLPVGQTYSVTETEENEGGYATIYGQNCKNVTLVQGQTVTCLVTNTYQKGRVVVNKVVVNNNGGTEKASAFEVALGAEKKMFTDTGTDTGTASFDVVPGAYVLGETPFDGYKATFSKGCESINAIMIAAGQTVTCTITNDDQAGTITLIKQVINDDGGTKKVSDFKLAVDGNGQHINATSGVAIILNAGNYKASELQLPGYETDGWTGACDLMGNFTLKLGQAATCYIINNDKPATIVVHKEVVNNNGGHKKAEQFKYRLDDGQWKYFGEGGVSIVEVDAGWHSVVEDEDDGYHASYEGCKYIYVKNGETKHCYIKNDDIAPKVTVMKWTDPYWSSQDFNFTMTSGEYQKEFVLDGHPFDDQVSNTYTTSHHFQEGWVSITEATTEGWDHLWTNCYVKEKWGLKQIGHPFKARIGEEYVCKVMNRQRGEVVVTKFNDQNQNGEWDEGEDTLEDWDMTLSSGRECEVELDMRVNSFMSEYSEEDHDYCDSEENTQTITTNEEGQAVFGNLKPGKYIVGEVQQEGWVQTGIYCEDYRDEVSFNSRKKYSESEDSDQTTYVWLRAGETQHCYVGNYQTPQIEVSLVPICKDNFPYLQWKVKPTNVVPTQFTLKWYTTAGNSAGDPADQLVETQVVPVANVTFDGTAYNGMSLWPGANTTTPDWPGWKLVNGIWVEDAHDFGGNLRPNARVAVTVNPTDEGTAAYPSVNSSCNPPQGVVLGTSTTKKLADTGVSAFVQVITGLSLVSLAIFLATRQKITTSK